MMIEDTSIFINNLRLYAFHGVMPQEQSVGAWYQVSLRVHYNISKAMQSDDVADTASYAELCQLVVELMAQPSRLLEHVAGRIAEAVFERYPDTLAVDLTIVKENPPMGVDCAGAGVELHLINDKTNS